MTSNMPKELDISENKQVILHIQDMSAHDGVADILVASVKPLGDVQTYCPNWDQFKYVVVSTNKIIFGVALGQNIVAYKLPNELSDVAVASGCKPYPELGADWFWVNPLRGDVPEIDFKYWARKAYTGIREKNLTNHSLMSSLY